MRRPDPPVRQTLFGLAGRSNPAPRSSTVAESTGPDPSGRAKPGCGAGGTRSARLSGVGNETARYEYPDVLRRGEETYRPTAAGRRRSDGEWEGWIEFADASGVERAATDIETTQPNADAFRYWADGVGVAYLEGALARALERRSTLLSTTPPAEPRPPGAHAILDPFEVHAQGERLLESQLGALEVDHLRNIVRAYEISSPESAASLSRSELIAAVLAAVRRTESRSTPRSR